MPTPALTGLDIAYSGSYRPRHCLLRLSRRERARERERVRERVRERERERERESERESQRERDRERTRGDAMLVFINAAHTIGALLLEDVRLPEVRTSVRRDLFI